MGKEYRKNKMGGIYSENLTTPVGRIFWLHVVEPKMYTGPIKEGDATPKPKFEATICFKKDDPKTIAFKASLETEAATMIEYFNVGKKQKLGGCEVLQDGDATDTDKSPWLAGCYFMTARSIRKPGCVARNPSEVIDSAILKGGMLGKLSFQGVVSNFGFSYSLGGLQMWEDDAVRFGSGTGLSPTSLFSACGDGEDDDVTEESSVKETPAVPAAQAADALKTTKGKGAIVNLL